MGLSDSANELFEVCCWTRIAYKATDCINVNWHGMRNTATEWSQGNGWPLKRTKDEDSIIIQKLSLKLVISKKQLLTASDVTKKLLSVLPINHTALIALQKWELYTWIITGSGISTCSFCWHYSVLVSNAVFTWFIYFHLWFLSTRFVYFDEIIF